MQSQKLDALLAEHWPSTLVASTPELAATGLGDRALTAGVRSGKLLRLRRGAYVRTVDWRRRKPWEREILRIQAHACSTSGQATYSHLSAARLHGCLDWEGGPQVHVTTPFSPAQASSGADVVAHGGPLNPEEITEVPAPWGGRVRVTSLERTVIDCARTLAFEAAVVIADQALRRGADPGILQHFPDSGRITRGARRLRQVLAAMDKRSESVGETRTRLLLHKLGIQEPVLQLEVETPIGTFRAETSEARCSVAGQQRNSGPGTCFCRREGFAMR
ncbi:hypothetical protein EU811_05995 [Arthrobacter sp. TS-15]|uniref:type IV toxin-antitoxin system AbiEi family antitoxin domain-containing protein n=1 Tax=Micrococcaceae TaxID=1268 RepID=UPI00115F6C95|nr:MULTISPECIES: type IV toxin-antitoxin system AbiEi family antitoxin domain-containing protein [Micrococcaceae]MCM0618425.1 type IV toxin-antitoxin system AbiEi family antitoxin domain-containing protein [Paenarthrobacter sp. TYUT067]TQS93388.1 hypothetical protein EU811_05995 [Arthrobacter sp. TS-15]